MDTCLPNITKHLKDGTLSSNVCRICLADDTELHDISKAPFELIGEYLTVQQIVETISTVKISAFDGFPERICRSCTEKAVAAYEFRLMCSESEDKIRNCMKGVLSELMKEYVQKFDLKKKKDAVLLVLSKEETKESHSNERVSVRKKLKKQPHDESKGNLDKASKGEVKFDYHCSLCSFICSNAAVLSLHEESHELNGRFVCLICKRDYKKKEFLKQHNVTHTESKQFLCPTCGKSFYFKITLQMHIERHSKVKKYQCDYCKKFFHTRVSIRNHINQLHQSAYSNFMCTECGEISRTLSQFASHRNKHRKGKGFTCQYCNKSYKGKRTLVEHIAQKHSEGEGPEKKSKKMLCVCDYCKKEFNMKETLRRHILSIHSDGRQFKCTLCEKIFKAEINLNIHLKVHNKKRPEQCDVCGNRFVNSKSLLLHQRLHTGERPYPCELCDERFLSSSRRTEHMKVKHLERSECCTICPSKFTRRSILKKHMLIHKMKGIARVRKGSVKKAAKPVELKPVLKNIENVNVFTVANENEGVNVCVANETETIDTFIGNGGAVENVNVYIGNEVEDVNAFIGNHEVGNVNAFVHDVSDVNAYVGTHEVDNVNAFVDDNDVNNVSLITVNNAIEKVNAYIINNDVKNMSAYNNTYVVQNNVGNMNTYVINSGVQTMNYVVDSGIDHAYVVDPSESVNNFVVDVNAFVFDNEVADMSTVAIDNGFKVDNVNNFVVEGDVGNINDYVVMNVNDFVDNTNFGIENRVENIHNNFEEIEYANNFGEASIQNVDDFVVENVSSCTVENNSDYVLQTL